MLAFWQVHALSGTKSIDHVLVAIGVAMAASVNNRCELYQPRWCETAVAINGKQPVQRGYETASDNFYEIGRTG